MEKREMLDRLFEEYLEDCEFDDLLEEARFWRNAYFDLKDKVANHSMYMEDEE